MDILPVRQCEDTSGSPRMEVHADNVHADNVNMPSHVTSYYIQPTTAHRSYQKKKSYKSLYGTSIW